MNRNERDRSHGCQGSEMINIKLSVLCAAAHSIAIGPIASCCTMIICGRFQAKPDDLLYRHSRNSPLRA